MLVEQEKQDVGMVASDVVIVLMLAILVQLPLIQRLAYLKLTKTNVPAVVLVQKLVQDTSLNYARKVQRVDVSM